MKQYTYFLTFKLLVDNIMVGESSAVISTYEPIINQDILINVTKKLQETFPEYQNKELFITNINFLHSSYDE